MNKTLLIIGFVWPEPKSSAAGSRMLQIIDAFLSADYNITFATPCAKSDKAFDLSTLNIAVHGIELNNSNFDDFVKELNPEVVLFDRFMIEEQFGWRVAEHCPNALRVLDTEDLHSLRKGRHEARKDNALFDKNYLYNDVAKREIASILRCDLSLMISFEEIEILKHQFNVDEHMLHYLPFLMDAISMDTQSKSPQFKDREHFITIGNFLHEPNYDAVVYLKETIWPIIRKKLKKAEMHVYGSYVTDEALKLNNPDEGFLIKGYADDVNEVMQQAKICLVPLRFGAGLKGKLIDAMVNGTPCVTTSIGAEGMYGTIESNAFIEDDPELFAKQAIELYTNKIYWKGKQKNGFMVINTRFDKAIFISDFLLKVETLKKNLKVQRRQNFMGQMLMHHTLQSTKYMSKWIEEKNKK